MYLYNKKESKLEVFCLNPQREQVCEYRKQQMKKIPEEESVFKAVTNEGITGYEIFSLYENRFDSQLIPIENANGSYHKLELDSLDNMFQRKEVLLDAYYLGNFIDRKIARIQDLKRIRYFLLNQTKYTSHNGMRELRGIIEIPQSLYLLSLIEQEKFSLIGNNDISEQLDLFQLEKLRELDLRSIERLYGMGIFQGDFSNIIRKAQNDEHILKLIKK